MVGSWLPYVFALLLLPLVEWVASMVVPHRVWVAAPPSTRVGLRTTFVFTFAQLLQFLSISDPVLITTTVGRWSMVFIITTLGFNALFCLFSSMDLNNTTDSNERADWWEFFFAETLAFSLADADVFGPQ
jgi:hypothetical protein